MSSAMIREAPVSTEKPPCKLDTVVQRHQRPPQPERGPKESGGQRTNRVVGLLTPILQ